MRRAGPRGSFKRGIFGGVGEGARGAIVPHSQRSGEAAAGGSSASRASRQQRRRDPRLETPLLPCCPLLRGGRPGAPSFSLLPDEASVAGGFPPSPPATHTSRQMNSVRAANRRPRRVSRPRPVQQQQERNNAAAAAGDRGKPSAAAPIGGLRGVRRRWASPRPAGYRQEKPRLLHPWRPLRPRFVWLGLCPGSGLLPCRRTGGRRGLGPFPGRAPTPAGEGGADRRQPPGTERVEWPPNLSPRPRGLRGGEPPSPGEAGASPRGAAGWAPGPAEGRGDAGEVTRESRGVRGERRPGGCGAGGGAGAGQLAPTPSPLPWAKWCPGAAARVSPSPRRAMFAAQFGSRASVTAPGGGARAVADRPFIYLSHTASFSPRAPPHPRRGTRRPRACRTGTGAPAPRASALPGGSARAAGAGA